LTVIDILSALSPGEDNPVRAFLSVSPEKAANAVDTQLNNVFRPVRSLSDQDPSGSAGATRSGAKARGVGESQHPGDSIRTGRVATDEKALDVSDQHLLDGHE
jgi:hypothetical protein